MSVPHHVTIFARDFFDHKGMLGSPWISRDNDLSRLEPFWGGYSPIPALLGLYLGIEYNCGYNVEI